nr:hypothetical protein [Tanacetum cinerariifolium]GEY94549.1 hypothetical protein [Tanacetum cinerariifolium]
MRIGTKLVDLKLKPWGFFVGAGEGGRDEGESRVSGGVGWKLGKVVLWIWREKWLVDEQYLLSRREGRGYCYRFGDFTWLVPGLTGDFHG